MLRVHALLQDKYKGRVPRRLCRYGHRCRRHRRGKCPHGHDGVSGLVNLWRHTPIDEDKARAWLTKPCTNPICGHMGLKRFHSICITREGAPCVPFMVCVSGMSNATENVFSSLAYTQGLYNHSRHVQLMAFHQLCHNTRAHIFSFLWQPVSRCCSMCGCPLVFDSGAEWPNGGRARNARLRTLSLIQRTRMRSRPCCQSCSTRTLYVPVRGLFNAHDIVWIKSEDLSMTT